MKLKRLIIPFIVLLLIAGGIAYWWHSTQPVLVTGRLIGGGQAPTGFAQADGIIPLPFPETFGPHPDFQTEWWYYTGNLDSEDGRHFGYQLTIFRRALLPADQRNERSSNWAADQVYFAHFTLTDVEGGQFLNFERFSRGAAGLAGAQVQPYRVWLEDWQIEEIEPGKYQLQARQGEITLSLVLQDTKGPVLQGDQGFSQKGDQPGSASYYYSQTHLVSQGTIQIDQQTFIVSGLSWKDHEFSTSALASDQVGWDWFSLQLDNDTEMMLFQIRQEDGSIAPSAAGLFVFPDGNTTRFDVNDFTITALGSWKSPHSGAQYPSGWRIEIPSLNLALTLTPYLDDQELLTSVIYWEGAVSIVGEINGEQVTGSGYVELTGYAHSMEGGF